MTRAAVRAPDPAGARFVFDGQSLCVWPPPEFSTDGRGPFPDRLMHGLGIPWETVALGDHAWGYEGSGDPLHLWTTIETRLFPQARSGYYDYLLMLGGSADIYRDHQTGAEVFARAVAYSQAARDAGFVVVYAATIPPFAGSLAPTADDLQARLDHNALMRANADGHFEAVMDVSVAPLDDPTDTTYYEADQVHWTTAGAKAAAEIIATVWVAPIFP